MDSQIVQLQAYVKKVEARLARLETRDLDLKGRRVINAAAAKLPQDYTTLSQVKDLLLPPSPKSSTQSRIFTLAYNSVVQSIPTGAGGAVLLFDTLIEDTGKLLTGGTFTAAVGGTYLAFCQTVYGTGGGGTFFQLQSYLNGAPSPALAEDTRITSLIIEPSLHILYPVKLIPGDYVEFFTNHDAAGAKNVLAGRSIAGLVKLD